jgi:hypothetical protein
LKSVNHSIADYDSCKKVHPKEVTKIQCQLEFLRVASQDQRKQSQLFCQLYKVLNCDTPKIKVMKSQEL